MTLHQRLPTSGARTALPYRLDGELYLIVPQLAEDVPGQPAYMNGGDSDVDAILYRWVNGAFVDHGRLPVPGGEDAELFSLDGQIFLATASVRTGAGPYDLNAISTVFRREGNRWEPFQTFPTFAAKQWHYFSFDGRHFLALAQGVTMPQAVPTVPRESCLYEWEGERFEPFQTLEGGWGYNFAFFEIAGSRFLAYADHTGPSLIYRWQNGQFVPCQTLAKRGGRAFQFFEAEERAWLAFATIDGPSTLFLWEGDRWVAHCEFGAPCGREFALVRSRDALHLFRIRFIEGAPADPVTALESEVHRWTGDGLAQVASFPTYGGTDAEPFTADGRTFLAVSSSLTPDVRFRQDMAIYRLAL